MDIEREEEKRKQIIDLKNSFTETEENLAIFFEALGDESWRVRKEAVELAITYPTDKILSLLLKGLSSEDNAGLRNASQEAFTKIGEKVIPFLKERFQQSDEDVRKFILDIFGDIKSEEACDFMIEAVNDPVENVVVAACENIGKIRCKKAVDTLLKLLAPDKQWLSFVIIEALAQIGVPFDAQNILPLFSISQFRKPILDLLPLINSPYDIEILKTSFRDNSNYIRLNAARKLLSLFEKEPFSLKNIKATLKDIISFSEGYKKLLESSSEDAKAFALLTFISEDEQLFTLMVDNGNDEAMEFFGNLINYAPFEKTFIIRNALTVYKDRKQAYIAYLCGLFHIEDTVKALIDLCRTQYGHTRQAVAFALGRLGGADAVNCLFSLMQDPFPDVREQAVNSLSLHLNKNNLPHGLVEEIFSKGKKDLLIALIELLDKTDNITEEHINRALRHPSDEVREKAIRIIGARNINSLLNDLLFYLTDENEQVRLAVIETLGIIGNKSCIEILSRFLKSDNFQIKRAAVESIYKISPDAIGLFESQIFEDLTPFTFFGLMTLLQKGVKLSPESFTKKAIEFDDKDIYVETLRFFRAVNLNEDAKKLANYLIKEKGNQYIPAHVMQELEESGV